MRRLILLLSLSLSAAFLGGCGQKGPLVLPTRPAAAAAAPASPAAAASSARLDHGQR
ncbi:MAG: sugar transporter [Rhodanobacter sp.]|nr:MAG: sugar transporter [Rhodanobacter sp.]